MPKDNTGDPTAFPTTFVTLVKTNPALVGATPKALWQKLEQQIQQAGGRVRESYDMAFSGDYDLMLIGEVGEPQDILRVDSACRYQPGVLKSHTAPIQNAEQHFNIVERQLAGAAGVR